MPNVARIKDGVVINIEVGDQAYADANATEDEILVVYEDEDGNAAANIGDLYDPEFGFTKECYVHLDLEGNPVFDDDGKPHLMDSFTHETVPTDDDGNPLGWYRIAGT